MNKDLSRLTATEAAAALKADRISVEELARACLARVAERDATVRAWSFVDPELVLQRARELDKTAVKGPLHGLPIGVKDMIDTFDMPTQHNSPIYVGHRPGQDAAGVATLRAAGALIFGKTDTVEFAAGGRKALTRNPHDLTRTPGGSSSGSAASVADFHVPLALGTQTGGSTLRPASFCGIVGMKPTWNAVNREGLKIYGASLDTLGLYGRAVSDIELLLEALAVGSDAPVEAKPAGALRIALCKTPVWRKAEAATKWALATAAERLKAAGATVTELRLPKAFDAVPEAQETIMHGEGRAAFRAEYFAAPHLLHQDFKERVENTKRITRAQLCAAYDLAAECRAAIDEIAGGYDAILAPASPGVAPVGLHTTGDHVFNKMWTVLHVPCIALPGLHDPETGLPIGVQLVAPRFHDRRLLAVAAAIEPLLAGKPATAAPKPAKTTRKKAA